MNQNQELNNTCILFDPNNEAQQKAIIKYYNDNGWHQSDFVKWAKDEAIGVYDKQLDYCQKSNKFKVIDLPKEYYLIDTPIVESEETLEQRLIDSLVFSESFEMDDMARMLELNRRFLNGGLPSDEYDERESLIEAFNILYKLY